ncbi:MAG: hypothetical protein ACO3Z6_02820 [Pseudomonadales bacterium]|jgi:hypothetical protein
MKLYALTAATLFLLATTTLRAQPAMQPAMEGALGSPRAEQTEGRQNLCLGGLDDKKLIVAESRIENPFRETSHLGCEIEGGTAVEMPDLPTPDVNPPRIA